MDYSNYFSGVVDLLKCLYFTKSSVHVISWILRIGSKFLPDGLSQEIREYEDSDLSGESLCINLIGKNDITIRVGSDGHLLVWEIKICS